jgi:5'-nucleotidase, C-terminal domain
VLASGEAAETLLADGPLERDEDRETGMGNLITDAFQVKTGADIALINAGGIRSALPPGPITYGFPVLPRNQSRRHQPIFEVSHIIPLFC